MDLNSALTSLQQSLHKMLADFSTLTVKTYTSDAAGGPPVLRASTEVKLDGDTSIIVPITADASIDVGLLTIHNNAVQSAIEARINTLEAVVKTARSLIG